jgi:hypothetical protein
VGPAQRGTPFSCTSFLDACSIPKLRIVRRATIKVYTPASLWVHDLSNFIEVLFDESGIRWIDVWRVFFLFACHLRHHGPNRLLLRQVAHDAPKFVFMLFTWLESRQQQKWTGVLGKHSHGRAGSGLISLSPPEAISPESPESICEFRRDSRPGTNTLLAFKKFVNRHPSGVGPTRVLCVPTVHEIFYLRYCVPSQFFPQILTERIPLAFIFWC